MNLDRRALRALECQTVAFARGDADWWRYGPGFELWSKNQWDLWRPQREIDEEDAAEGTRTDGDDGLPEGGARAGLDVPAEPARDFVRGPRIVVV